MKPKLRTEWKHGEPPLTEEEQAALSESIKQKNIEHVRRNGPRFHFDEVAIQVQGEKEYKRRNYLDGFPSISLNRMRELSLWHLIENERIDIAIGYSSFFAAGSDPSDKEILSLEHIENPSDPKAPVDNEEWRFVREVIRPEKTERLTSLLEMRIKEQATRAEIARAALRGENSEHIEVKVTDLKRLLDDHQEIIATITNEAMKTRKSIMDAAEGVQNHVTEHTRKDGKGRPHTHAPKIRDSRLDDFAEWKKNNPVISDKKAAEYYCLDCMGLSEFDELTDAQEGKLQARMDELRHQREAKRGEEKRGNIKVRTK